MNFSDPFEAAFTDYFAGDFTAQLCISNNKGESENVPVQRFFRTYKEMSELEKLALDLCEGKVLDIGAGAGSHSLYLQDKGFEVYALDIRQGLVNIMKKRGVEKTIHGNIFRLKDLKFDTLLLLMNGIGLTENLDGLQKFLHLAKDLLNSSGQIIFDSSDLMYLYENEDGSFTIRLNEDYYGEVEYQVKYRSIEGKPFKWLFVDFLTLMQYAETMGYSGELMYEDHHHNYLARLTI